MRRSSRFACALFVLVVTAPNAARAQSLSLFAGGQNRTYLLHRPAGLGRTTPAPLVIVLHGGFGSGSQAESAYHWNAAADRSGFVVAYPDGIRRAWNAGGACCGYPSRNNVDDVGFLTRLIQTLARAENIDPKRVYLTGISNGGAMAYRYACEGPYPIAAIGSVAASFSFPCRQAHAVSVMEIHGLDDRNVPFAGGYGSKGVAHIQWLPVEQTLDVFRRANHCQAPAARTAGAVRTEIARCAAGRNVTLITIAGAGHQWPGGQPHRGPLARMLLDAPSDALDATSVLWDFFRRHPAP